MSAKQKNAVWVWFFLLVVLILTNLAHAQDVPDLEISGVSVSPSTVDMSSLSIPITVSATIKNLSLFGTARSFFVKVYLSQDCPGISVCHNELINVPPNTQVGPPYNFTDDWIIIPEPEDTKTRSVNSAFINILYGRADCSLGPCEVKVTITFTLPFFWADETPMNPDNHFIAIVVDPTDGETNIQNNRAEDFRLNVIDGTSVADDDLPPSPSPPPSVGANPNFPVPGQPTLTRLSPSQVRVDWKDVVAPTCPLAVNDPNCNWSSELTHYNIMWSTDPGFKNPPSLRNCPESYPFLGGSGSYTICAKADDDEPSEKVIADLTASSTYYVVVNAVYNYCGTSKFLNNCLLGSGLTATGVTSFWSQVAVITPNRPPNKPSNPLPNPGANVSPPSVSLRWSGGDPDGDDVIYTVYLSKNSREVNNLSAPRAHLASLQEQSQYSLNSALIISTMENCSIYYWKVVAQDDDGRKTVGDTWFFPTTCKPTASISADETYGRYPLTVDFHAQAQAQAGFSIASYEWKFCDLGYSDPISCPGGTSASANPTYVYPNIGIYTAFLRVRDDRGLISDWASISITVSINVGPEFQIGGQDVWRSRTAYDSRRDQYLVVWAEMRSDFRNWSLNGAIIKTVRDGQGNTKGQIVRGPFLIVLNSVNGVASSLDNFAVAYSPVADQYLLVYMSNLRDTPSMTGVHWRLADVQGILLDLNGNSISAAFNIAQSSSAYQVEQTQLLEPQVVFGNTDYLISWRAVHCVWQVSKCDHDNYAAMVSTTGTIWKTMKLLPGYTISAPDIIYKGFEVKGVGFDGERFLIQGLYTAQSWTMASGRQEPILGVFVDQLGNVNATPDFRIDGEHIYYGEMAYDSVNRRYLMVWSNAPNIQGVLVNIDGTVAKEPFNIVTNSGFTTDAWLQPAAVFDGLHYLLAWQNFSVRTRTFRITGARVRADGSAIDPNGIPISSSDTAGAATILGSANGTYNVLVIWPDTRGGIWGVVTHAATPVTQPLADPTPPPPQPLPGVDLRVEGVSLFPVILKTGSPVTVRPTIRNGGTQGTGGPFEVRYYWSASLPVTEGSPIYTQQFTSGLGGSAALTESFTFTPPAGPDGVYYLGVVVDPLDQIAEADEFNNLTLTTLSQDSTAPAVNILSPQGGASIRGQVPILFSIEGAIEASVVEFYLDGSLATSNLITLKNGLWTWDTMRVLNGTHTLSVKIYDIAGNVGISPNVSLQVNNPLSAPTGLTVADRTADQGGTLVLTWTPSTTFAATQQRIYRGTTSGGPYNLVTTITDKTTSSYTNTGLANGTTYYYIVRAFDAAAESPNSNQASAIPRDNLAPTISGITSGSITLNGATITWATNEASDTQVEYGTTTSYGSNSPLNTAMVVSHSTTLSGLSASTLYHYRVKSRDAAGNLATSGDFTFTTGSSSTSGPDLIMGTVSAIASATNLTINDVVRNIGNLNAGAFNVGFYLSADNSYQSTDTFLCQRSLSGLAAGTSNSASGTSVTTCSTSAVTPGLYYVIGFADLGASVAEKVETNNTWPSSTQISIGPDLIVSFISASKSSNTLTINNAVKNQGSWSAGVSEISFYLSTDQTLSTASDTFVCKRSVTSLNAGVSSPTSGATTTTCTIPTVPAGSYYLIGFADSAGVVTEARENNNTQTGAFITVP